MLKRIDTSFQQHLDSFRAKQVNYFLFSSVSEKFNEYLSQGMSKDEALQKAKLYFIQNSSSEKMLPYYWANMILIGNTDAIDLATKHNNYWWWIAGIGFVILLFGFLYRKKIIRAER